MMVFGLIPAREGSKRLPEKNIRPLAGYPLIAYSIAAAKLCSRIDRIIVSTDSKKIAEVSRRYGAEVPFMRPAEFARDLSPDREFVMHALEWFEKNEGSMPQYLVHLRPPIPLRDSALIDEAISTIMSDPEATSLRSGYEAPESPFKWFTRDEHGYFRSFNPADPRPGASNLPNQLFPVVYIPVGHVDVLRTSFVLNSDDIHGNRIIGFITPPCYEIDDLETLEFVEFQLEKKGSPLLDFLKHNYRKEA